ncbi:32289_t:CDS:1, partial [Racocetra persica]
NYNNELYGYKNHNHELSLKEVEINSYLPEVSNLEYYRPKEHPPKQLKSSIESSFNKHTKLLVDP